ncbi:pentapeptide repeat-containing protein [Acaryochloris sp. IP29b_bin.137]|uniref:pentapeptide repeat-containing protein n=1 Tax=Acaryochloris sp. IP29b_bin.137 TaxID=2969217 RepID=UPI002605907F|nr:pentapeptide repeat-containing protein [Acaryochloris sp. IP29b_bin.137]
MHPYSTDHSQTPTPASSLTNPQDFLEAVLAGQRNFVGADLENADLSDADLSNLDLRQINLCGANLSGTNLNHTDLTEANLDNTNLTNANLTRANLTRCDLRTATLKPQNWYWANLSWTNLTGQNLSHACLERVDFQGANLSEVNLSQADLTHAKLDAAKLHSANLTKATLHAAYLPYAQLTSADCSGAELTWADLTGANCTQSKFQHVNFNMARLRQANLQSANLHKAYLKHCKLNKADLSSANLQKSDLTEADLKDALLVQTDLRGVDLSGHEEIDFSASITGPHPSEQIEVSKQLELDSCGTSVALSADSQLLAYLDWDNQVTVMDTRSGTKKQKIDIQSDPVVSNVFKTDGQQLYQYLYQNELKLWNVVNGELKENLKDHPENLTSVVLNHQAKLMGMTGVGEPYEEYDLGHERRTFKGYSSGICAEAESSDGYLIARSHDSSVGQIELLKRETGEVIEIFKGHCVPVQSLAFSPDSQMLASFSASEFKIWDIAAGAVMFEEKINVMSEHIPTLAFVFNNNSDEHTLLTDHFFSKFYHRDAVASSRQSARDKILARRRERRLGKSQTISVDWNAQGGGSISPAHSVLSGNGQVLARQYGEQPAQLWNLKKTQAIGSLVFKDDANYPLALNFSGDVLAVGNCNGFSIWDLTTLTLKHRFTGHADYLRYLAFSPDGQLIASSSWDNTIKLWNLEEESEIATLHEYTCVTCLTFSSTGSLFASGDRDGIIKFWDLETLSVLLSFRGHDRDVENLIFSADNQFLVSSGDDRKIRLWQITSNNV